MFIRYAKDNPEYKEVMRQLEELKKIEEDDFIKYGPKISSQVEIMKKSLEMQLKFKNKNIRD